MATNSADILADEDRELLLQRYLDIEWCDDVTHLRCVRCDRVAISHYVSNCQHLFCRNCRTIFSDGGRWKCPRCHEYVTRLNDQDVEIENELNRSKVCCPNKKYGCQHVDQLKNITNHMKVCEHTREAALPMEYTGENTMDLLYRHVSGLSEQLRQMSDEMRVMKSESEANWKQIQAKMNELESKVDNNVDQFNRDLDGFRSDLYLQEEKLISWETKTEGGVSDKKTVPMLEEMREEIERVKLKQKKMSIKAKEDLEAIYTVKGRVDAFIQLLEQKDEKLTTKLNKHEAKIKNMTDVCEAHLEDVNVKIATMSTKQEADKRAMTQLDHKMSMLSNDIQKQNEQFTAMQQRGKEERNREMEQLKQRQMEEMKGQLYAYGNELRLKMSLIEAEMKAVPALPLSSDKICQINTEVYEWTIKKEELRDLTKARTTEVFRIQEYPFGLVFSLKLYKNKIYIAHQLEDVYNTKRLITRSMPKIIYVLLNQSINSWDRKRDVIIYDDYGFESVIAYSLPKGYRLLCDYSRLLDAPYNSNGNIKIKLLIEPPSISNSFASNDGVLYWRVDNYRERKRMEEDGLIEGPESPYFYTAPQGHRVAALVNLNQMTVWIESYKGEYDDKLTLHIKHRITITLFDQSDPSKNLVKSFEHNKLNDEIYHKLCDPSEVEKYGYVKNDSILLKFEVETLSK